MCFSAFILTSKKLNILKDISKSLLNNCKERFRILTNLSLCSYYGHIGHLVFVIYVVKSKTVYVQ